MGSKLKLDCQSKEDGICTLPIGSCEQCSEKSQTNMNTNFINRSNDEEIINILNSILSNGNFKVETINEAVLTKLMELRGTPIKKYKSLRDINKDYENWLATVPVKDNHILGRNTSIVKPKEDFKESIHTSPIQADEISERATQLRKEYHSILKDDTKYLEGLSLFAIRKIAELQLEMEKLLNRASTPQIEG